jgi:hypothetical protein
MSNPRNPSQRKVLTFIQQFKARNRFAFPAKGIAARFMIGKKRLLLFQHLGAQGVFTVPTTLSAEDRVRR